MGRKFEGLLLASASIVWWTDAAGEFVKKQPYWEEYTGQTWEEYRGSRWLSCLHPDDREAVLADWTSAVSSGSPYFTQGRIWSAKHNAYRTFQTRGIPIKAESGEVREWLGALIDIQDTIDIKVLLERTQADLANSLKALRVSEAKSRAQLAELQAIYDAAPMGIAIIDKDARFLRVNKALSRMDGIEVEDHIGKKVSEVTPAGWVQAEAPFRRVLEAGEALRVAINDAGATSGDTRYGEAVLFPLHLEDGVEAVGVIVEEVTGRRSTEDRLRESEARLAEQALALKRLNDASSRLWQMRGLQEGLDEMLRASMELVRADKGNIQLLEPARGTLAIAAHYGFERPFLDFFKEVSAGGIGAGARALRTGKRVIIEDTEVEEDYEPVRAVAREAGFRALQCTPLLGRSGTVLGIMSTHFKQPRPPFTSSELQLLDLYARQTADFIERWRADEALRKSEERYRGIFQNAVIGISITDLNGHFISCNPAYSAMHGYTEDELRQLSFNDVVHSDDRARHAAEIKRLLSEEVNSFEITNRCLGKDGRQLWVQKHVSLLRDGAGRPANVIALVTNITERKRAEEQINLLMREVNHRSKNLLTLVQAIARQTAARCPEEFLSRFEERIRALARSHDLLTKNEWKGVYLNELIRIQLSHFRDAIGSRIKLQGPGVFLSASAAQTLGMAFVELATNAGKYGALSNETGRVDLSWEIIKGEGCEDAFVLEWRESGGPPVKGPSRSGFGSTIIQRMTEAGLNAEVELNFRPEGLRWHLHCALSNIIGMPPRAAALPANAAANRKGPAGKPRILVVEDEALVALEIEEMLQGEGFEVVGPAKKVVSALELLEERGCDAAILNINLGSESSEPLARTLHERGIPFLVLSGYSQDQRPAGFENAPFLVKPLTSELLVSQLRRCIEQAAVHEAQP